MEYAIYAYTIIGGGVAGFVLGSDGKMKEAILWFFLWLPGFLFYLIAGLLSRISDYLSLRFWWKFYFTKTFSTYDRSAYLNAEQYLRIPKMRGLGEVIARLAMRKYLQRYKSNHNNRPRA